MYTIIKFNITDETNTKISSLAFGSLFYNPGFLEELDNILFSDFAGSKPEPQLKEDVFNFIKEYTLTYYKSKRFFLKSYSAKYNIKDYNSFNIEKIPSKGKPTYVISFSLETYNA